MSINTLISMLAAALLLALSQPASAAIDPSTVQKVSGNSMSWYGCAVSVHGNTALVGASDDNNDIGAAYVFVRATDGSWNQQARLIPSDGAVPDSFGSSVSLSGDTAVIGAMSDDNRRGSVYVFVRSGTTWSQQAKLIPSDSASYFGAFVSVDGDTALIGPTSNAAYVFVRSGTTWTQQAKLTAPDTATYINFGRAVSVRGDTALIGAYTDTDSGSYSGAAYVFIRSGATWSFQAKLAASDAAAYNHFGCSVSLSDDTALIGAWQSSNGSIRPGAAYVFTRSGSTWTQQAKLTSSDGAAHDSFGTSVSVSGDTALIGAANDDGGIGAAYVFIRSGSAWSEQSKLTAPDKSVDDYFGQYVSVDGDIAIVAAPESESNIDPGAVYLYGPSRSAGSGKFLPALQLLL